MNYESRNGKRAYLSRAAQSTGARSAPACWWLLIGALAPAASAFGQVPNATPAPIFPSLDANGVNVPTGAFVHSQTDFAIGQPGAGGLTYTRYFQTAPKFSVANGSWTHNHNGYVDYVSGPGGSGTKCLVVIGAMTESFTSSGINCQGPFTSDQQQGATLVRVLSVPSTLVYTSKDGWTATFTMQALGSQVVLGASGTAGAYLTSTTSPHGEVTTYTYETVFAPYMRLRGVSNNLGYRLGLEYPSQDLVGPNRITGVNAAVENCSGSDCSSAWPYVTLSYVPNGQIEIVTNALGVQTVYSYSGPTVTDIQFPDHPDHDISIGYSSGRVSSVDHGFGSFTYGYAPDGNGSLTTTVTNPDGTIVAYTSTIETGRLTSARNEVNQTTSYIYDSAARLTRVTAPEGNFTEFTLDARGNTTQTRQVSKASDPLPDIITSAEYPASCANQKTCNQPTSTTDARGFRTDYVYDASHGGVTTITAPAPAGAAPVGSGDRPQTRFEYEQHQAYYMTPAGTWTSGAAVWRPTKQSACAVGIYPSCIGTANETFTYLSYANAGTPDNLLPTHIQNAAGNHAISQLIATTAMTYTPWGDVRTIDGPLSGSADTTRFYYDGARRLIGVVGPDPDGAGALLFRAERTSYNAVNQPTLVERGTTTNQGDAALSTFVSLENLSTVYDSFARPIESRRWSGSASTLTQINYDIRSRSQCVAVRMNPATFSNPPDACVLSAAGAFGSDLITRTFYDNAGRVYQQHSAYGTPLAQTTGRLTYTANGQVQTLTDALDNRTTYEYDGFDRLKKRRYPHPTTKNSSSTTDFDQYNYYAFGALQEQIPRGGGSTDKFTVSYDNLGRLTARDAPGTQPDVTYGYDLLSRATSAVQSGHSVTTIYDALSRATNVTSSAGSVSYQYHADGRRQRMTYPDGMYFTYVYNSAGDPTGILENGATSLATLGYDNLGRRTSLTRANGSVVTNYDYDELSRLDYLNQNVAGTGHDLTVDFDHDPASRITARVSNNALFEQMLSLDRAESYVADGLNQYDSAFGITPSYDVRGNLTSDGARTYAYDFDNRLTSSSGATLKYDPTDRLYEVAGAATTRFLYDGANVIAEYNSSGTMLRRYVPGPGVDEILAVYEGAGTADRRFPIADERGSVVGITNGSGTLTQINKYDPYGGPDGGNQGRFQYTGQMWIDDLKLYHYKARAYHPRLGRFMQPDPIGYAGGMNLYAYVGNDPLNHKDPTGLCGFGAIYTAQYWDNNSQTLTHRTWFNCYTPSTPGDGVFLPPGTGGSEGGGQSGESGGGSEEGPPEPSSPEDASQECVNYGQVGAGLLEMALGTAQMIGGAGQFAASAGLTGTGPGAVVGVPGMLAGAGNLGLGFLATNDGRNLIRTGFDGRQRPTSLGAIGGVFAGDTGREVGDSATLLLGVIGLRNLANGGIKNAGFTMNFAMELANATIGMVAGESYLPCQTPY